MGEPTKSPPKKSQRSSLSCSPRDKSPASSSPYCAVASSPDVPPFNFSPLQQCVFSPASEKPQKSLTSSGRGKGHHRGATQERVNVFVGLLMNKAPNLTNQDLQELADAVGLEAGGDKIK